MPKQDRSLVERVSSLLVAADLILAEATRLVEQLDIEQDRDFVDDHLGIRFDDIIKRGEQLRRMIDGDGHE